MAEGDARASDAFEEARLKGYATGHAAGIRAAAGEVEAATARLQREADAARSAFVAQAGQAMAAVDAAIARVDDAFSRIAAADRSDLMRLAVELAEVIIGAELSDAETSARSVLARTLAEVDAAAVHRVRISPEDYEQLRSADALPSGADMQPDPELRPGDAVVELADGQIDMRVAQAIERARRLTAAGAPSDSHE